MSTKPMTKEKVRKKAEAQAKKDSAKAAAKKLGKKDFKKLGMKEGSKGNRPKNARKYGSEGAAKTKDPKQDRQQKKRLKELGKEVGRIARREKGQETAKDKRQSRRATKKTIKHVKKHGSGYKPKETTGPGKMPDGYSMQRPAEKLGYIQKLGAGRMSPGKMGDMTAMKMMHGDAAAKYYDGAGMYMNGAPKYEGASKSYMGPGAHKPGHIEGLPSYTTTKTTTTRSGGESSSVSGSSSGGGSQTKTKLEKAQSGTRTKQSDSDYMTSLSKNKKFSGRTGAEMAEAGHISKSNIGAYDKIAGTSSSGGSTSSKSTTKKSTEPTVKTQTKKETKVIGTETQKDVLGRGKEMLSNRANRLKAEREKAMIQSQKDSIAAANKKLAKFSGPLTQRQLDLAHREGQSAGRRSLFKAQSSEQAPGGGYNKLFRATELGEFYNPKSGTTGYKGTGVGEKPHKKISKRNPEVKESFVHGTGSLGERPMLEDYAGGTPKMPKGPMKFGMKK